MQILPHRARRDDVVAALQDELARGAGLDPGEPLVPSLDHLACAQLAGLCLRATARLDVAEVRPIRRPRRVREVDARGRRELGRRDGGHVRTTAGADGERERAAPQREQPAVALPGVVQGLLFRASSDDHGALGITLAATLRGSRAPGEVRPTENGSRRQGRTGTTSKRLTRTRPC